MNDQKIRMLKNWTPYKWNARHKYGKKTEFNENHAYNELSDQCQYLNN